MKLASSEGWTVLPAGAMTWLDVGLRSRRTHIVVSTGRLNRIIAHEPADLVAVTEAGVSLKNFNDALRQKGQWLPLDPPHHGSATIGGVVASGLGGAQQFGYGAPRKHVIGMKVVLADGKLIKVGGRVVKNVAGYDLCKLFTGSYGTLGVIVEVNFKLRPLPFETTTVMAWGQREDLLAGAQRVIDARLFPVAVELLSQPLASEAQLFAEKDKVLLIRFAGSRNGVIEQSTQAVELLGKDGLRLAPLAGDDSQLWHSVAADASRFQNDLVWRVGLLPAAVPTFLARLDQSSVGNGSSELSWRVSVADGRIRVVDQLGPSGNVSGDKIQNANLLLESFRDFAKNLGATLIVEQAPAEIRDRVNSWKTFGTAYGIMQRIKQQLDPDSIFPALAL
jgi:FAD/FMN-containing dehydrogenase